MKKFIGILAFGLIVISFCWTCKPLVTYPIEPQIDFKSLVLSKDTDKLGNDVVKAVLTFKVIDGDGDIGLPEEVYPGFEDLGNKDLFLKILKKTDDGFIPDKIEYPFQIPYFEPEGQDKSLVADIEVTNRAFVKGTLPKDTTIKFSFYLYDRQLHKSNVAETPEFPSDTLGTIIAPEFKEE